MSSDPRPIIPIYVAPVRIGRLLEAKRYEDVAGGEVYKVYVARSAEEARAFKEGVSLGLNYSQLSFVDPVDAEAVVNAPYFLKEARRRYGAKGIQIAIWRRHNIRTGERFDMRVAISAEHDWSKGPYGNTVPFAVGSNEEILPVEP